MTTYTVDGWREDGTILHGKDDDTGEMVTLLVTQELYTNYLEYLRAAAKVGMPNPTIAERAVTVLSRRRMTLGDYGFNND